MNNNRIPLLPKLNAEHFSKREEVVSRQMIEQEYKRPEQAPIRRRKKMNRQNYTLYKCLPDRRCFTNVELSLEIKDQQTANHQENYHQNVKNNENQLHITSIGERKHQNKKQRNQIFKIKTNFMTLETNFQKVSNRLQRSQDLIKNKSLSKILKFKAILKLQQEYLRQGTRLHHPNTFFNIQCLQKMTNKYANLSISDQGSGNLYVNQNKKREKRKPAIYRYSKAKKQSQKMVKQQIIGWNHQSSINQYIGQDYISINQ